MMAEHSDNVEHHDGERLELFLLGPFIAQVGDRNVIDRNWRLRKATTLVQVLALTPGFQLHRDQIIDLLWPDSPLNSAFNNLYQALHVARRTLGTLFRAQQPPRLLALDHHIVLLGPHGSIWTDVNQFEELFQRSMVSDSVRIHQQAVDLYRGDLLCDDPYSDQFANHRQILRSKYHSLLFRLAQVYDTGGRPGQAIATLEAILENDSVHEDAHVELMHLFARAGLRFQALSQFDILREALHRELDASPQPSTVALRNQIQSGEYRPRRQPGKEDLVTPVQTFRHTQHRGRLPPSTIPTNLPPPRDALISRDREMNEVVMMMTVSRLLTLSGPGGIGKTRLAIAVGQRMVLAFPDGVYLVPLAAVRDAGLVVGQIAQVLNVRETAAEPLADTVAREIDEREMLLVLDNFEHVRAAGPEVTTLLAQCPHLKVLITSRVQLRLMGEQEYPVPPLAMPSEEEALSPEALEQYGAVMLFVERAGQVQPDFSLTPEVAQTVARIVRQLDGLPLAIELAAARIRLLPPDDILARLSRPLDILTGGSPDQPERLQTIRNTIAWSYNLLGEPERGALRQLSVFVNGWSFEAAEQVVHLDHGHDPSVLNALDTLLHHSLINRQTTGVTDRLTMLETIREYAGEQLHRLGEHLDTGHRHAMYFAVLAERAAPELSGERQDRWLDLLQQELGNLRAALTHCIDHPVDREIGMRIAGSLWLFWDIRGHLAEGRRWLDRLIAMSDGHGQHHASCCFAAGYLATRQGDAAIARPRLEAALAAYEEIGDLAGSGRTLGMLGTVASFEGHFAESTVLLERALTTFREIDDELGIARTLLDLGDQVRVEGDYERARDLLSESLRRLRGLGFERAAGWALANLGNTARAVDDDQLAANYFEESQDVFAALEDKRGLSRPVLYLANLARRRYDLVTATKLFRESLALLRDIEDKWRLPVWVYYVGLLAVDCGRHETGVRLLSAADASSNHFQSLLDPAEREDGKQVLRVATNAIGRDAARIAWDAGARASMDRAITQGLALLDEIETESRGS